MRGARREQRAGPPAALQVALQRTGTRVVHSPGDALGQGFQTILLAFVVRFVQQFHADDFTVGPQGPGPVRAMGLQQHPRRSRPYGSSDGGCPGWPHQPGAGPGHAPAPQDAAGSFTLGQKPGSAEPVRSARRGPVPARLASVACTMAADAVQPAQQRRRVVHAPLIQASAPPSWTRARPCTSPSVHAPTSKPLAATAASSSRRSRPARFGAKRKSSPTSIFHAQTCTSTSLG